MGRGSLELETKSGFPIEREKPAGRHWPGWNSNRCQGVGFRMGWHMA